MVRRVQRRFEETPVTIWLQPFVDWWNHPPAYEGHTTVDFLEGDLAISQGNRGWNNLDGRVGVGGDFQAFKKSYTESSSLGTTPRHFSTWAWNDPMAPGVTHHLYAPRSKFGNVTDESFTAEYGHVRYTPRSMSELDAMGTTAISRMIPTNPLSGLAAFLGELREGLPRLGFETWASRTGRARSAGSDYLNVEFGWKPLVSDLQSFNHSVNNANKIIAQYVKDAGKPIHRTYNFPIEEEVHQTGFEWGTQYPQPFLDDALYPYPNYPGRRKVNLSVKRETWCEAAFTYYLPPMGTAGWNSAVANRLFGTRITPDVVWQLTPWSWAIDWFSNLGDVIKNVSAFMNDGLVMPYAFIMEHCSMKLEYQLEEAAFKSYPGANTMRQTFEMEVKTRRKATPYGFGFDLSSLTGRQLAIGAALGLSKS